MTFRPKLEDGSILTTNSKVEDPEAIRATDCFFIHLDNENRIETAHGMMRRGTAHTNGEAPKTVANLTFQAKNTTDIQVAMLEPACRELAMDAWYKELSNDADKNFGKLRE